MTMDYAQTKHLIANIDPQSLIIQGIHHEKHKLELAEEDYNKAVLNHRERANVSHDYSIIAFAHDECMYRKGKIDAAKDCLRYMLAQEAETNGRKVSADMTEFDKVIEEMVNGNLV